MKKWIFIVCTILVGKTLSAQSNTFKNYLKENTSFQLYVKDLHTTFLFNGFDDALIENRIHERLKFKWYANDNITVNFEWRNQFIYGGFAGKINELLKVYAPLAQLQNPEIDFPESYGEMLNSKENPIDLSRVFWERNSALLYSQIDRFWFEYAKGNYIITIGRQRINWGVNWVWNPNDLFNTASFLDFDYEERPGTDAVRFQYYLKKNGKFELAFHPETDIENSIFAGLYKFNKWKYDVQLISAFYKNNFVAGLGWAGNIKNVGFKGEFSFFQPFENQGGKLVGNLGFDYSFNSGLIIQAEALYNQFGVNEASIVETSFLNTNNLSATNLWVYKWAVATGANYAVNPRLTVGASFLLNPTDWSFYAVPNLNISISEQFDWYFIGQFTQKQNDPTDLIGDFYGSFSSRLRWSF